MPAEITIRPARPEDQAFVMTLAERFSATRPAWRTSDEVTRGTQRALENAFAPSASQALLIALDPGGERVGFVWVVTHTDFFTGESHAHVSELAVARDGEGVGSRLMDAAEAWAQARGDRYISLNVQVGNERARQLYELRGFAPEHTAYAKQL